MSHVPQLLRLARHCRYAWARPHHVCAAQHRAAAAAAGGGVPPPPPPPTTRAACGRPCASASRAAAAPHASHQRRGVAAAAGRRGNVFLDDSAAGKRKPANDEREPMTGPLFDSSHFNYDSDEEEESAAQPPQQQPGHDGEATAAAAAAQQARRRGGGAPAGDGEPPADIVLPPPRGVKVKSAEFVKSSVSVEQCPQARFPEFAVIGRSNVGKSSLINLLTGRSSLAMVSKTPGKTRCINHFLINGAWYLVDLPGYGYARTSKANSVEWNRFTREYFLERETLVTVLLLVDASVPPQPLDVACAAWFAQAEIPFTLVFTKLDKRKKGGSPAEDNIAAFEREVEEACGYLPPAILTSSRSGRGRNELLAHVAQLRDFFNKTHHGL